MCRQLHAAEECYCAGSITLFFYDNQSVRTPYLRGAPRRFFFGEVIASLLGVSRSAVWKAVKSLEAEGYAVSAVTNMGYCIAAGTDILSPEGFRLYLSLEYRDIPITIHKVTGSTNEDAKALAVAGAVHGTMVLAEEQTRGRGPLADRFTRRKVPASI